MAMLSISFDVPDEDAARMLAAFRRRIGNPDLTPEQMLAFLKENARQQIVDVVMAEERNAIEEQKAAVTPIAMA